MTSSKAGGIRRREMAGAVLIGGMGLGGDTNAADDLYALVDPQMVAPLKALDLPDHYTPQVMEARRNLPLPPPCPRRRLDRSAEPYRDPRARPT